MKSVKFEIPAYRELMNTPLRETTTGMEFNPLMSIGKAKTIGEFLSLSPDELKNTRNMGKKKIAMAKDAVLSYSLEWLKNHKPDAYEQLLSSGIKIV